MLVHGCLVLIKGLNHSIKCFCKISKTKASFYSCVQEESDFPNGTEKQLGARTRGSGAYDAVVCLGLYEKLGWWKEIV